MTVYFAQAGGPDGPVKIGVSRNIQMRIRSIQNGCPDDVCVIREIDGGHREEMWLHRHFRDCRKRGEWFDYHPEMLVIIPDLSEHPAPMPTKARPDTFVGMLIEAFDGPTKMSRATGIPITTIVSWESRGNVPSWRYDAIRRAARKVKVRLPEAMENAT